MNYVHLTGNIYRILDFRKTADGVLAVKGMVKFKTTRKYRSGKGYISSTYYFEGYGSQAELLQKYAVIGDPIMLTGELIVEPIQNNETEKISFVHYIYVKNIELPQQSIKNIRRKHFINQIQNSAESCTIVETATETYECV